MSEQEITKWTNKYKLWLVLHGGENAGGGCSFCDKRNVMNCDEIETLVYNPSTKRTIMEKTGFGNKVCIEWIRHV